LFDMPAKESDSRLPRQHFSPETAQSSQYTAPPRIRDCERFRRRAPYRDGTPTHDHLGDIFARLDAQAFQRCFVAWVAALTKTPAEVIAIDGKTVRRSHQKKGSKEPIHHMQYRMKRDS
jgi:hypothetical protein